MTRKQLYEKYGNVKVSFASYCNLKFTFDSIIQDAETKTCKRIVCTYGGTSDDICEFDFCSNDEIPIEDLSPDYVSVYQNGIEIEHFP